MPRHPLATDTLPRWKPSTAYLAGDVLVHPDGNIKVSLTNHTSSSTVPGVLNWADPPALAALASLRARDLARQRAITSRQYPRRAVPVVLPAGFGWAPGVPIFYNGARYFTTYDVAVRRNTGGTKRYVNTATGLNTNDGLTEATAYLSLNQAYSVAVDGDEIVVVNKGVSYRNQSNITGLNITKSVNLVAKYPGETILSSADKLTYTAHATIPGVWQAARTNVLQVVDLLVDPEGYLYPKVANEAALGAAAPGSWASDATTLFVKPVDGIAPDNARILALLDAAMFNFVGDARTSAQRIYLEGVWIMGGQNGVKVTNTSAFRTQFAAKDSKFLWSGWTTADALPILGNVDCYTQRCTAANSGKDGFNYHATGGFIPNFVEIDPNGHSNGLYAAGGDYTMNASTAHDGVKGLRIGGKYHHTMGTPVADVNAGTQVLMYSCDAWDSLAPIGSGYNAAIAAQQSGAELWLYGCRAWGAELSLYCVTGATMHIIETEYDTVNGAGTLDIVSAL
ncbi:minor tail protein [Arthrobacter phage Bolt007]|uniref:Minor tail protein n=1 Tax=Arthrobacter phage Bolt007 TaxID=3017297 RepID=A0AA49I6E1_9CAUD|nr:minor tail protein [Arthrobacter phage Bolt007]